MIENPIELEVAIEEMLIYLGRTQKKTDLEPKIASLRDDFTKLLTMFNDMRREVAAFKSEAIAQIRSETVEIVRGRERESFLKRLFG